jgi:hypothetical protein
VGCFTPWSVQGLLDSPAVTRPRDPGHLLRRGVYQYRPVSPKPSPILPEKAGVVENQHFSKVTELLFDAPIKVHFASRKKSPHRHSRSGDFPVLSSRSSDGLSPRRRFPNGSGRSSDFPALLAAFPSGTQLLERSHFLPAGARSGGFEAPGISSELLSAGQWHTEARRVPLS